MSLGCQRIEKKNAQKYLATLNGRTFLVEEIDSVISEQIFQLRRNTLKNLLRSTIFEYEAQKLKVSKEELLQRKINIYGKVSSTQYLNYVVELGIDSKSIDTTKILDYLSSKNKQTHFEHFTDSLLSESDITINFPPVQFTKVNVDELDYHELSNGRKIIVYVISDYNCHSCQNAEKQLRKIIKKYGHIVGFRFVYYSEYIDSKALIAEAAANQNKFFEFHEFLFNHPEINLKDQLIYDFLENNGINMDMFLNDVQNPNTLKNLMRNKEKIMKEKIYFTPSFVINNKLLNDEFSLYTLENLINEEL